MQVQRSPFDPAHRSRKSFITWSALALLGVPATGLAAKGPPAAPPPPPPPPQEVKNEAFDWFANTTPGYFQSPFLSDQTADAVNAFLKSRPADEPKAVKVVAPISTSTSNLIFNNPSYQVSYILGDFEVPPTPDKVKALAQQVRYINGQNNGTKTQSFNAYIGNFGHQKLNADFTTPGGYKQNRDQHSFAGYDVGAYQSSKLNLSMPELYSGSASYRNPAAGNSTAPNIRSATFTLPLLRVAQVEVNTNSDERNIPWVARFNNFGNPALDSDRDGSNGYEFETGKAIPASGGLPAVSADKTAEQLLSRRDFATMLAHERMRGADSYVLFEPGVVGYSDEEKRSDARTGWTQPNIDNIFKADDHQLVLGKNGGQNPKDVFSSLVVDGTTRTAEETGSIFSGVYSLSLQTLDVMLSNLDEVDHTLTLPKSIGGYDLKTNSFTLDDGSSLLVEYKLQTSGMNKGWSVAVTQVPFQALSNSRHGFGIPEPSTITLAGVTAFLLIGRRQRSRRDDATA
jgi:hypothetical protein